MRSFYVSSDSDDDYLQQWHYITGETILTCLAASGIRGQVLGSAVGSMTDPILKAVGHMAYPRLVAWQACLNLAQAVGRWSDFKLAAGRTSDSTLGGWESAMRLAASLIQGWQLD